MKKILILPSIVILFWIGAGMISSGADDNYMKYVRTDSTYVYKWNATDVTWVLSQVQFYQYSDGRLSEILTKDLTMGYNVEHSVYLYDEYGRLQSATNSFYMEEWIYSTRALYEYDVDGKTISVRVQKWSGDAWVEDRLQQNYEYDVDEKLQAYETIYWRSNSWTLPTISELSYNTLGKLEYHLATRPGGSIDYQIIYEYSEMGLLNQFYTQYPSGAGWSNWNLRTFQYNGCGSKASQIQYSGEGPNWVPSTKIVFHSSFDELLYPGRKVPVCHNGHTIWIAIQALPAHLRHGDCLGECQNERIRPQEKSQNPPFILFPNPAKERITVRFSQDLDCELRRLELTDFSGNLIKVYDISDNSDFVIERGKLKSGYYQITLKGEEDWGQIIVFK